MSRTAPDLYHVDWSKVPQPEDDGGARHLIGLVVPKEVRLASTDGRQVALGELPGLSVLYVYPSTGVPGQPLPTDDWDMIPGARGCTPQACAFRDHFDELREAGADHVFGLSVQDSAHQKEAAQRLHLPFALLSDDKLQFGRALCLPSMVVGDLTLLKRITLILDDGAIRHVFYPVFPPDQNAGDVLEWLKNRL